ncbi:MAG: hypothetical protein IKK28_02155, partial [Mogibacterium sp.]|nr:hypothetical protein [Mogibacterium sp.]
LALSLGACSKKGSADLEDGEIEVSMDDENDVAQLDDEELEKNGNTLESRLPLLKEDGWKADGDKYVFTTNEDNTGEYRISAKGNEADLEVAFDYGDSNKEMISFYKEDTAAVKAVTAYWYMRATGVLGIYEGNVNYVFKVGDTVVGEGKMSFDEAADACEDYFQG